MPIWSIKQAQAVGDRVASGVASRARRLMAQMRESVSLRMALVLLIGGLVLPAIALAVLEHRRAAAERQAEVATAAQSLARTVAFDLDRELSIRTALLRTLAASPWLASGDLATLYAQARAVVSGDMDWIVLVDATGKQLFNTRFSYGSPLPGVGDLATLQEVARSGTIRLSDLFGGVAQDVSVGRPLLSLSIPVGSDLVLTWRFQPEVFNEVLRHQRPRGWSAALHDRNGRLVALSERADELVGREHPGLSAILIADPKGFRRSGSDRAATLSAWHRLEHGWTASVHVDEATALAAVRGFDRLITRTLLLGLLALALAAWLAAWIHRQFAEATREAVSLDAAERTRPGEPMLREARETVRLVQIAKSAAEERIKAAEALVAGEDRFRQAADATGAIVYDVDLLAGGDASAYGIARFIGEDAPSDRLSTAWWHGRIHSHDLQPHLDHLGRCLADPTCILYEASYRVRHTDGSWRDVEDVARIVRGPSGEAARLVGTILDVSARRQAEAALRASERKLQSAIEIAQLEPYEWTPSSGALEWGARLKSWWGLAPDAHVDFDLFLAGVHPADRPHVQEQLAKALDPGGDGAYAAEFRVIDRGGSIERWISTRGQTIFDAERRPAHFVGAAQDITVHKQADATLRESEARLSFSLRGASAGAWEWHIRSGKVTWSPENYALYDIEPSPDGPSYADWEARLHPDDREPTNRAIRGVVEGRDAEYKAEFRVVRRDGTVRWLVGLGNIERAGDGSPLRMSGINIDVTARKRVEEALRDSEQRLSLALHASATGVWDWDVATDRVGWSGHIYPIFGVEQFDGTRDAFARFVHPDDAEQVWAAVSAALDTGGMAIEFRIVRGDGEERWVNNHATVFRDAAGKPVRMLGTVRDITERKRADQRLRDSERRHAFLLRLSDRLRQLSDPAAISAEATRILGEELDVARAAFYEIDNADYVIPAIHTRGVAPLTGRYPVAAYGLDLLAQQSRGKPIVVPDVTRVHSEAEVERFAQIEIGAYLNVPLVKDEQFVAGLTAHSPTPRDWTSTEVGLVQDAAERTWAAVERARTEAALQAAHDTFRHLVDRSPFGVYVVDADFRLVQVSDGAQKVFANVRPLFGRDFAEVLHIIWPEPFATETVGRFRHTLETGEPYRSPSTIEHRADTAAKEAYDWRIERLILPDGRPGVVCHFYDLSERQRHEEHIQLLMREVNHRSKNMLGLIQAVARQTAATRPEDFIERFGQRVQALAANQDLLVKSEWKTVPLHDLVRSQLAHFGTVRDTRVVLDGPPVEVTASASQALGMALHELATNAAKYGALSRALGRVTVSWRLHSDAKSGRRFTMSWLENGGPPVERPSRRGFGSTVIDGMVKMSLGCDTEIDFAPTGLVWRIDCPADNVIEGSGARPAMRSSGPVGERATSADRRRVMVVEDEALIAMEIASTLSDAGWDVIGPASTVAQALALIAEGGCDAAVLDTNLGAETAEPIARELIKSGTPFVTVSGYSREQQPLVMRGAPLIGKPVNPRALVAEISRRLS